MSSVVSTSRVTGCTHPAGPELVEIPFHLCKIAHACDIWKVFSSFGFGPVWGYCDEVGSTDRQHSLPSIATAGVKRMMGGGDVLHGICLFDDGGEGATVGEGRQICQ